MAKAGELYEQDFFLWTKEQAAALRLAKNSNLPLDWENLAEEIESLGKSPRAEVTNPADSPAPPQTRSLSLGRTAGRMALDRP